ncbi:MAG: hypothetical protein E7314_07620 [Clostridiales bacterium]|nr:hypothetical protein [Clostridiales bacterium]
MNIRKHALTVFMFIFLAVVMIVPAKAVQFSDLAPNHWGYEKIVEFVQKGYMKGYDDNTFKPDGSLTRAEFVHVINNYFGFTGNENVVTTLSDVNQNEWYAKGVNEAIARGYMIGYEDGTFRPNNPITRQEAIVVLAKILNLNDNTSSEVALEYLKAKYSDYNTIEPWALNAMYNFSKLGYINGYEDGTLRAASIMTRTEVVHMMIPVEQKIVVEKEEPKKPSKGGSSGGSSSGGNSEPVVPETVYYTITVNPSENGTIVVEPTSVEKGKTAVVTITPATSYELASILDNGTDVTANVLNGVYTIVNVQANHTISATFSLIPVTPEQPEEPVAKYTITVTSNEKGEAVADFTEIEEGKTVKVTLTPGKAYRLYTLTDNGVDATGNVVNSVYTIENVQGNHEVVAIFGCNCEECIAELIKTIKAIAEKHEDLIINIAALASTIEGNADFGALINKIEEKVSQEVANLEVKVEEFIANHDCAEVQAFITKLDNKLQSIDSMETLIKEIEKHIKANVSREDIEKAIELLTEKYNCTVEELKTKLENNKDKIVEEITNKIIAAKEYQDKIIETIEQIKAEIKDALPTEAELKAMAEELLAKGEATLETLKEKLEEKVAEREAKIQQVIAELKAELKENLPTEEELRAMAEELLAKNQAKLDTLKEKLIAKIEGTLEESEDKWNEFLEDIKDKIAENMPSAEELSELLDLIEAAIPKIEELTGIDVSEIADKLGIDKETVSDVIEAINGNEELKAELKEVIKDKVTDVISNALSDNSTVEKVLDKIYEEAEMDVVDLMLLLAEKDTTGIATKVVLSNTELSEVLDAIDASLTEEDLETVVTACVDYYGLNEFVKTVNGKDNAKELLTIAIENANVTDLIAAVQDATVREIILDNFTISELATILGPRGEDVINSLLGIVKVSYDRNAEKATGETIGSTHNKYLAIPLTTNGFVREGYTFKGWATTEDGSVEYTDGEKITSAGFDSSTVILYAVWEANTYTITSYSSNGNSVTAKAEAKTDEVVTITIVEANEYQEFKEVKINGKTIEGNSFIMPACNVTITAIFNDNTPTAHTITTISTDETKGTITSDLSSTTAGNVVTIIIEAEEGYKLSSITANSGVVSLTKVSDTKYTFTMPDAEVTVNAAFEAIQYDIIFNKTGEGTVNVVATATVGQEITITATPEEGYELQSITSDDVTITDGEFTMPAGDVEIDVTFEPKSYGYTLSIEGEGSAYVISEDTLKSIDSIDDIKNVESDNTIKYTHKAYIIWTDDVVGYDFDSVIATGVDDVNDGELNLIVAKIPYKTFTMPANNDVKITVSFGKVDTYTVTVVNSEGGTATVSTTEAEDDDKVYIEIEEEEGYTLKSCKVTDLEDNTLYDLTKALTKDFDMPAEDVKIIVEFVDIYPITVAGGANLVVVSEIPPINSILDVVSVLTTAKVGESKYGETVCVFSLDDIKVDDWSIKLNEFNISVEDMSNRKIQHTGSTLSIKGLFSTYNIPYKTFTMPDGPVTITKQ